MVKLFASKSKLLSVMADLNGKFIYCGKFSNLFAKEVYAYRQDELWVMYIHEDEFERLGREGKHIFSQKEKIKEYLSECRKAEDCYKEFCTQIQELGNRDQGFYGIVKNYYKIYSLLMAQYRITNFETTHSLSMDEDNSVILAQNRWNMRKTFMNGNRIFYDYVRSALNMNNFDEVIPFLTIENLLEFKRMHGIGAIRNITGIKCDDKKIDFISSDEIEDNQVKKNLLSNIYARGVNVSKVACVRGKALVLKEGILDKDSQELLRRDKFIVITLSLHFDVTEFVDHILGLACDEGGALSHSGIIAREYQIPCITGTKSGTTLFQTGEVVELDTEKEILKHCILDTCKGTTDQMNNDLDNALRKYLTDSEIETVYGNIDSEVNRDIKENAVDYESVLENVFLEELGFDRNK